MSTTFRTCNLHYIGCRISLFIFSFLLPVSVPGNSAGVNLYRDSLHRQLALVPNDTARFVILKKLFDDAIYVADSARLYAHTLYQLGSLIQDENFKREAVTAYTSYYTRHTTDTDTILKALRKFYLQMEAAGSESGMAAACKLIGRVYMKHSLDSAMHYNVKCLELFRKINNESGVQGVMVNIAAIYYHLGRFKDAINATREPFEYSLATGDLARAGTCAVNMGEYYDNLKQYDSALYYLGESLRFNTIRKDPYGIAHANSLMGGIFQKLRNYTKARDHYAISVKIGEATGFGEILNMAYNGLAQMAFAEKNYELALRYNRLSEKYLIENKETETALFKLYFDIHYARGDWKSAVDSYMKYISLRDSFQSHEQIQTIHTLEATYKAKEKQAQLELLQRENQMNAAIAGRETLFRNGLMVFLLVAAAITLLLFNRFKLKKQIESQQAIIDERKRIGRELHDDLGAQLSTAKMFLSNLKKETASGNQQEKLVNNSLTIIENSISDLRKIMNDLHFGTLQEKGYLPATEELINRINELQKVRFTLSHFGMEKRIQPKIEHNLFRITQELINNSLKYAEASQVSIHVMQKNEWVVLTYEDDGKGFDPGNESMGYGLSNIQSRASSMGGSFQYDTATGKGFHCQVELPI